MKNWAAQKYMRLEFIKLGSPYQNGYVERFNRSYREEVLDLYLFESLQQVRDIIDEWLDIYNYEWPNDALRD
ncbi:integrase core domain-containing protein [Pseudoalteromonas maricaloris]